MLLLDVRVGIGKEYETKLNEWYYTHIPRLMSVPGYVSGRRYVSLGEGPQFAALYEIGDSRDVARLVGDDHYQRHPLTLSEWNSWEEELEPVMDYSDIGLYESKAGVAPILHADYPIVRCAFELGDASPQELAELANEIVGYADVEAVVALSASGHERAQWLQTAPGQVLIVECASEGIAINIASGHTPPGERLKAFMQTLETDQEPTSVAYRQVARHWPWFKLKQ